MAEVAETILAVAQDLNFQLMARHGGLTLETQIAAVETLKATLEAAQKSQISEIVLKNIRNGKT